MIASNLSKNKNLLSLFQKNQRFNYLFLAEKFSLTNLTAEKWKEKLVNFNPKTFEDCLPSLILLPTLSQDLQNSVKWTSILSTVDPETKNILELTGLFYAMAYSDSPEFNCSSLLNVMKPKIIASLFNLNCYTFSLALAAFNKLNTSTEEWKTIFTHAFENKENLNVDQILEVLKSIYLAKQLKTQSTEDLKEIFEFVSKKQSFLNISQYYHFSLLCRELSFENLIDSQAAENVYFSEESIEQSDLVEFCVNLAKSVKGTQFLWDSISSILNAFDFSLEEGINIIWALTSMGQNNEEVISLLRNLTTQISEGLSHQQLIMLLISATQLQIQDSEINFRLRDCAMTFNEFKGSEIIVLSQHFQICLPNDAEYRNFIRSSSLRDEDFMGRMRKLRETLS